MDRFKAWWKQNKIAIKTATSTAAIITVLVTTVYMFIWSLEAILSWGVDTLGLTWLIRTWVLGSFIYAGILLVEEIKIYRHNPKEYGFHGLTDNEEEELH